ncbi:MAG TPA: TonB-dependent receptor, partial [Sphingomicrobium sp.]|nr:TonB-dependent receptor [Sphingomicrobium sp.]
APGYSSALIPTLSSTCAPLDIFGVGNESQAALDYVTAIAQTDQKNSQLDLVADVNGSVVHLPGGDAKISLGVEHRRESTSFDPGAFYYGQVNPDGSRTQYGNSIPIDPVSGAYHTDEAFGELNIPVVSADMGVPMVNSLNLQGAARYVKNSMTGGFLAYTGGGTYAPVKALTLRGNYTRSFRAPAITEVFAPTGSVFDTANDPCDARYVNGGPDPANRAANCAAAGITQPFTSNVVDYTLPGTFGGNPDLQNETANSWTAGAVLAPPFLRGFTLQGDYIAIDVKNEIASLGLTDLMDACYDAPDYPSNPFCSTFTRDSSGQVSSFAEGNYNIGIEHFRALQMALDYNFPLSRFGLPHSAGSLGIGVNYLHTFSHYTRVGEGDIEYSVGTTQEPKDDVTANLNYTNGPFNFLWQTIYYGPTKLDVNDPSSTYQYPSVHSYFMFNSSIGYDLNKHVSARLIVNNVFNKSVPFPYAVSQTRYFDALMGRYFKLNLGVKF